MRRLRAIILALAIPAALIGPAPAEADPVDPSVLVGTVRVVVIDYTDGTSASRTILEVDGVHYTLQGAGTGDLESGSRVRVEGTADGHRITAQSVRILSGGAPPVAGERPAFLVVPVYWTTARSSSPATAPDGTTPEQLEERVTGSASSWFQEVSNGHVTGFEADATPWIEIENPGGMWEDLLAGPAFNEISTKARARGYDPADYDRILIYMPSVSGIFGGIATLGGRVALINGRASLTSGSVEHELVHLFGAGHASTHTCFVDGRSVTLGGSCRTDPYGDEADVMGGSSFIGAKGHPGAVLMDTLGWLDKRVVDVPKRGGRFVLHPIEGQRSNRQVLRLGDGEHDYWLSYREPVGVDSFLAGHPSYTGGLSIYTDAPDAGQVLLDPVPGDAKDDGVLKFGTGWTTPNGRYTITVRRVGGTDAQVTINLN
jgi:hypothetical protein